jgi:hypothetical protein
MALAQSSDSSAGSSAPVINSGAPPQFLRQAPPPPAPPPSLANSPRSFPGAPSSRPSFPNVEMKVEPKAGLENECPVLVQLFDFETPSEDTLPFYGTPRTQEAPRGSTAALQMEGDAPLQWISQGGFSLATRATHEVTWVARLHDKYARCEGSAWLIKRDGVARKKEQSYLFLTFASGNVSLRLDLARRNLDSKLQWAGLAGGGRPAWRYVSTRPINASPAGLPQSTESRAGDAK